MNESELRRLRVQIGRLRKLMAEIKLYRAELKKPSKLKLIGEINEIGKGKVWK